MEGRYPQIGPLRELRYSVSKLRLNDALSRQRRQKSHTARRVWQQDRTQPTEQRQVRFWASEVDPFLDHAATWSRADPPRLCAAGNSDRGRRERRRCAAGSLRIGRRLSRHRQSSSASRRRMQRRRRTSRCARCSRLSCWESSTVLAPVRSHCASASRCLRPARSWRGCGRNFVCSRLTRRVLSITPACSLRSARRSAGSCSARPALIRARAKFPDPIDRSRNFARRLHSRRTARHPDHRADPRCLCGRGRSRPRRRGERSARPGHARCVQASCCEATNCRTDCQIIRPGERYFDDRGFEMWNTVTRLLGKLEARSA